MPPADAGYYSERSLTLLAAALAAILFVLPLTVSFPLLDPDEGLHASIAQAMVERGDWITPQSLGQPFLDKPIFYFWAEAASLWLLGPSEAAARLPGLIFGLLGAATTGLLGWRLFDRATGWIAGILYATTILPTAMAQAASHDVALIVWINLTLLMLWQSERAPTRRAIVACVVGAGVFLGLATLTKGFFGAAVVGMAYGGRLLYLLMPIDRPISDAAPFSRRACPPCGESTAKHGGQARPLHSSSRLKTMLAILARGMAVLLLAVLVASPWYILADARNPGFLRHFFLERHVLGLATTSQPHGDQPWWYYLPILLGGGLPWIGYLPVVVQDGLAHRRGSDAMPFLWIWLIGWTLLMTLAGSKLVTYLWPAFPPMAVLAATAWAGLLDGTLSVPARRLLTRTFVWSSWTGPILLPAAALAVQAVFDVRFAWPAWLAVGVAAAVAPLPLIPWRAGRWQASLAAATLSLAVQFVVAMTMLLPPVAETFSARPLAEHFNRLGRVPSRLVVAEGRIGSLVFYLAPRLRAELRPGQLQQFSAQDLPPLQPGDVLAVPERKVPKLRGYFDVDGNRYESIGAYRLYRSRE